MKNPFLSIVIPAYNEEKRLGVTLEKIKNYMDLQDYEYDVVVVSDGSTDGTREVAENSLLYKDGKLRFFCNVKNMGKGFSVKKGVSSVDGEWILFTDADLSTPMKEIDKLFKKSENGADIVIGSRAVKTSKVEVRQPFYRQLMGKTFNLLIRVVLNQKFKDTQCGFKLFKGKTAKRIFQETKLAGFAFDVEMLFLALRYGFKVEEVGVIWINSKESRVHPIFSSLQMFRDIIRIRFIHR